MKTPLCRRRQKGAILLVIIVLVALLLFLGFTLWQIWKMIQKLPSQPANQVELTAGNALAEFQSNHVGEVISVVSTQVTTLTLIQPFQPSDVAVLVWRSTNLIDWDCVATNLPGETWTDPSPPQPCGFYKQTLR